MDLCFLFCLRILAAVGWEVKNYRKAKEFIGRLSRKAWEAYRKYHFFSYGLQQVF